MFAPVRWGALMSGNDTNLPRATADEIAQPLAFALQFNRRKRDHSTEESSIWMSAVEAVHWAARGELGLLDFLLVKPALCGLMTWSARA